MMQSIMYSLGPGITNGSVDSHSFFWLRCVPLDMSSGASEGCKLGSDGVTPSGPTTVNALHSRRTWTCEK
eukprot:scaffold2214_cov195-Alexandrium_tamarense.AAC.2